MAHGASCGMKSKNAIRAGPTVDEHMRISAANVMAINTGLSGGKIGSVTLQHIMWGMRVGVEVSSVTANAVAGSHRHHRGRGSLVSICNTQEKSRGGIVTGGAGIMNLVVASAQRDTGGGAGSIRMAACAFR